MPGRSTLTQASRTSGLQDGALFVALMATAIALGAALAHLLELPNKISLTRDQYFTVQAIYAGWWQLAYVLMVQLVGLIAVCWLWRRRGAVLGFALLALACLVGAQIVFWIWTQPANAATANWTVIPENWQHLRRQWEFSHAAGALLQLGSMASLILATLASRKPARCVPTRLAPPIDTA